MKAGEGRSTSWPPREVWLGLLLGLATGCALCRPALDRAIPPGKGLTARTENAADLYTVFCPDVLDVTIDSRPDLSGQRGVGPDGRIDFRALGRLHVEGCTVVQTASLVAETAGVPPGQVHVHVAEYKSQQLYVIGQVAGFQCVVPYQGPETVVDLLHRVGGIAAGAAPDDVRVVRSRISDGKLPDVVHVDLQAILVRHDQRTNILLQPQDQIFVAETRQFSISKCIPPWLRPLYETLCGMRRPEEHDKVTR